MFNAGFAQAYKVLGFTSHFVLLWFGPDPNSGNSTSLVGVDLFFFKFKFLETLKSCHKELSSQDGSKKAQDCINPPSGKKHYFPGNAVTFFLYYYKGGGSNNNTIAERTAEKNSALHEKVNTSFVVEKTASWKRWETATMSRLSRLCSVSADNQNQCWQPDFRSWQIQYDADLQCIHTQPLLLGPKTLKWTSTVQNHRPSSRSGRYQGKCRSLLCHCWSSSILPDTVDWTKQHFRNWSRTKGHFFWYFLYSIVDSM